MVVAVSYGAAGLERASPRVPRIMHVALAVVMSVGFICAVGTAVVWSTPSPTELVGQQQMMMVPMRQPNGQVVYVVEPMQAQQQTLAANMATTQAAPMSLPISVAVPLTQAKPVAAARKYAPVKAETEQQAKARAKALAEKDYLATYNAAIKAEDAAEVKERQRRAAWAEHDKKRADMFKTLKGKADRKEGWGKLRREIGMIMDGVDGLHYVGPRT